MLLVDRVLNFSIPLRFRILSVLLTHVVICVLLFLNICLPKKNPEFSRWDGVTDYYSGRAYGFPLRCVVFDSDLVGQHFPDGSFSIIDHDHDIRQPSGGYTRPTLIIWPRAAGNAGLCLLITYAFFVFLCWLLPPKAPQSSVTHPPESPAPNGASGPTKR